MLVSDEVSGTKRLTPAQLDAVAETINSILDDDFGGRDRHGAQSEFAAKIDISQPHISQACKGSKGAREICSRRN